MSQENVEVVSRILEAFNRGDGESVRELWATDAEWRPAYFGEGLLAGTVFSGVDRIVEFVDLQAETWERVDLLTLGTRHQQDWVLVELRISAIGRASGIPVDRVTWNVYKLRDGKITTGRAYTNEREALKALGLEE